MTPDEFATIQRTLDRRALEQVAMLQRIASYLSVLRGLAAIACFLLFLLVLKLV